MNPFLKLKKYGYIYVMAVVFLIALLAFFIIVLVLIKNTFNKDNELYLNSIADRIQLDLVHKEGKWDTTLYNSDPLTPYPNSSGSAPIYIITNDGYVIERSKPINGFLDTADIKHLLQFTIPTTLSTLTNENWRVFSQDIKENNEIIGVVMVAYHNPEISIIEDIDNKLANNLNKIIGQLILRNGQIDTNKLDIRTIDYNISFEIVTKTNRVILSNGRTPTFIDPSYVENELKFENSRTIEDKVSKESFIVLSQPLYTDNGNAGGIVVVARSIEFEDKLIVNYLKIGVSLIIILIILFIALLNRIFKYYLHKQAVIELENINKIEPKAIIFDHKQSNLQLNDKKFNIAYASNQYYMLKSLFSKPGKLWENDELLEKFGEDLEESGHKKVYDTSLALNKKLGIRLIQYKDKTFTINPQYKKIISYI
jgi:hypothetical protein